MIMQDLSSRFFTFVLRVLLLCAGIASVTFGQTQKQKLTLEWIFGPEGRSVASLPSTAWLDDGTLIMLDNRRPANERTFERLDTATGARTSLVNRSAALATLPEGMKDDPLQWPIAFDGAGRQALYLLKGDVFVLELDRNRFRRLTSTPAEETSASFSPNGHRVAYVRENNLYSFDLDTNSETQLTRDGSETLLNGTLSWVYWEEVFGRRDIGYWWAPDSNGIAYLQSDDSKVDLAYFTDIQPFSPRVIKQRYARAGRPNPTVRLGIIEMANPSVTTWINIKEPFEYIVRAKWLPDGRRLSLQTMPRVQTELSLYLADRKTGAATRVLTETDPGWVNMNDDLYFYADGQHFLWPSERDGYMHLYRYRMDGTLVNQVTKGTWRWRVPEELRSGFISPESALMRRMIGSTSLHSNDLRLSVTYIACIVMAPDFRLFRKSQVHIASRCHLMRNIISTGIPIFGHFRLYAFTPQTAAIRKRLRLRGPSYSRSSTFSFRS